MFQREITRKLTFPKQPTNPFLEMVKFLLERIAPVHIDSEAIRSENRNIKSSITQVLGFVFHNRTKVLAYVLIPIEYVYGMDGKP